MKAVQLPSSPPEGLMEDLDRPSSNELIKDSVKKRHGGKDEFYKSMIQATGFEIPILKTLIFKSDWSTIWFIGLWFFITYVVFFSSN